ncbi:methylated-DNA--[protein]-cysteine S-methyltransferase [Halobacteriovorax sp. GB3]|uniref:methylated-DNA--[protein]-cysteine S-methyltransferase n=1 Tax=Halobacteriovorax sp. GB3 TaxID=2719615 RepID=UPI00235E00AD|nr:methylated-DNA--[protein]-cysteine S-methyltransferase [Halobacteriovorax sp. GB3]MDD0853763.1 methylated-DNA--[protein]-cysteine S-methyltransferase [Halobacteriovorax sp. GB3]
METFLSTPIGVLRIIANESALQAVEFQKSMPKNFEEDLENNVILKKAKTQLTEYFEGKRKSFDLPLDLSRGSEFQQKVWRGLLEIPFGETRTYGQLAKAIGNPKGQRAVGGANNKNPLPIIVPCHRVVAKNSIGGFALGQNVKIWLLSREKNA